MRREHQDTDNSDLQPLVPFERTLLGHRSPVVRVKFLSKGNPLQLVSVSQDGVSFIHDLSRSEGEAVRAPITAHDGSLAVTAEGHVVGGSDLGNLLLWHLDTDEATVRQTGHQVPVTSVDIASSGANLVAAFEDGTVMLWHYAKTTHICLETEVFCVKFSPSANSFALSTETDIHIYLLDNPHDSGLRVKKIQDAHRHIITSLVWSRDGGSIISGSFDRQIRVWDTTSMEEVKDPFCGHFDGIYWLSLSPNGRVLASASRDCKVSLWDVESRQLITTLLHSHAVYCVEFSPTSETIVTADNDAIVLWDASGLDILTLPSYSGASYNDSYLDVPIIRLSAIPVGEIHLSELGPLQPVLEEDTVRIPSEHPQRQQTFRLLRLSIDRFRRPLANTRDHRSKLRVAEIATARADRIWRVTPSTCFEPPIRTRPTTPDPDGLDDNVGVGCFTLLMRKARFRR